MAPTTSRAPSEQTEGRQILDRLEELSGQVRALAERPAVAQVEFKQSWWDQVDGELASYLTNAIGICTDFPINGSHPHGLIQMRVVTTQDGLELMVWRAGGVIYWQRKLFYGRRPNGGR